MSPEQKLKLLQVMAISSSVGLVAAQYVIAKQDKELHKVRRAFRTMADVSSLYEGYVPPDILAQGNELLQFAQIEINFDD